MRNASAYAAKIKRCVGQLRKRYGKPVTPEPTDALDQMLLGILGRDTTDARARKALAALQEAMVDVNDLRVTPVHDIVEVIGGDYPDATARAKCVRAALMDLFNRESALGLEFLRERGRREGRQYLESLQGVDAFSAAGVVLWSFGGHAVPVDEPLLAFLRRKELVDRKADLDAVQAFLERYISAADAPTYVALLRKHVAGRVPAAPRAAPAQKKSAPAQKATPKTKSAGKSTTAKRSQAAPPTRKLRTTSRAKKKARSGGRRRAKAAGK